MFCIQSTLPPSLLGLFVALAAGPALRAAEPTAIFVMKIDGSEVRRVADVQGYEHHGSPRWSHDGRKLAFDVAKAEGDDRHWFLVNADGSGAREMGRGAHPDWSPDDKQLVFAVGAGAPVKQGIWVQNDDGQGRVWLAAGDCSRWSPRDGALAILDGGSLALLDLIELETKPVGSQKGVQPGFDWSPDGKQLAYVTTRDGEQALWIADVEQGRAPEKRLSGDLDGTVAWSPDGKQLAVALAGKLCLLPIERGAAPRPIAGQEGVNRMPVWSPDGQWLAFASTRTSPVLAPVAAARRTVRLEEEKRHTRGNIVYGFDLSLDGRQVLLGGKTDLEIWNLDSDESRLVGLHGELVSLSPDGHTVAQGGPLVKIALGDLETGQTVRDLHTGSMCTNVEFSPDGRRVVTGTIDKRVIVFDVATGKRVHVFENHHAPITRVAFLPNGQEVASNGQDRKLRIWNAETGAERLVIDHPEVPWGLAISPDGRLIATGTGGQTEGNPIMQLIQPSTEYVIRLWDSASGELVREMPGHTEVAYALSFSADGRTLASGGWDASIRLWDVATGRQLASVQGAGSAYGVAITPDGGRLVVIGGENRSAGSRIRRYPDEQVRVYRIVEGETEQGEARP